MLNNSEALPTEERLTVDLNASENNSSALVKLSPGQERRRLMNEQQASRSPMSPGASSPIYNRYKYYSALKTGFEHLAPQNEEEALSGPEMFAAPTHLNNFNTDFFVLQNPFKEPKKSKFHSIASCEITYSAGRSLRAID